MKNTRQRPWHFCSVNKNAQKKAKSTSKTTFGLLQAKFISCILYFCSLAKLRLNSTGKCSYILLERNKLLKGQKWSNRTIIWDRRISEYLTCALKILPSAKYSTNYGRPRPEQPSRSWKAKLRENNSLLSCRQFCLLLFLPFYGLV